MEARTLLTFDFNSAIGIGAGIVHPEKTAIDAAGDIYVTGNFLGQNVNFGSDGAAPGVNPVVSSSSTNTPNTLAIFVAKYAPSGVLLWIDPFIQVSTNQASPDDIGAAVAVDGVGDVFVTGTYNGQVNFSANSSSPDVSTAAVGYDIFILKLSTRPARWGCSRPSGRRPAMRGTTMG